LQFEKHFRKRFRAIVGEKGWQLGRIKGSHHVYTKPGNPARISVPIHGNKALKIGLLKHFMKISGIAESEL